MSRLNGQQFPPNEISSFSFFFIFFEILSSGRIRERSINNRSWRRSKNWTTNKTGYRWWWTFYNGGLGSRLEIFFLSYERILPIFQTTSFKLIKNELNISQIYLVFLENIEKIAISCFQTFTRVSPVPFVNLIRRKISNDSQFSGHFFRLLPSPVVKANEPPL